MATGTPKSKPIFRAAMTNHETVLAACQSPSPSAHKRSSGLSCPLTAIDRNARELYGASLGATPTVVPFQSCPDRICSWICVSCRRGPVGRGRSSDTSEFLPFVEAIRRSLQITLGNSTLVPNLCRRLTIHGVDSTGHAEPLPEASQTRTARVRVRVLACKVTFPYSLCFNVNVIYLLGERHY